jgi:hypothetical protein
MLNQEDEVNTLKSTSQILVNINITWEYIERSHF